MSESASPLGEAALPPGAALRRMLRVLVILLAVLGGILWWTVSSDHNAPGTSRAMISANVAQIAPRVSGRVISVDTHDNAILSEGDALFTLDPRPFELAVERARAQLEQAIQGVDAGSAQLEAAQAQVAQARAGLDNARDAAERAEALLARGVTSRAAHDNAQANLQAAEAALAAAEASAESARRQLGVEDDTNPQIRAAELALEQAEYDLISTVVAAPSRGVVTNLHLTVGQFIGAGQAGVTFIDASDIWIAADLRENQLLYVNPGDRVTLAFDAMPGRIYEGRVDSLGWGINPGRNEAGGLPVNTPTTQWFEPARKMPIRIVMEGGTDAYPSKARLGGRVGVVIYPEGRGGIVSWLSGRFQWIGAQLSALY